MIVIIFRVSCRLTECSTWRRNKLNGMNILADKKVYLTSSSCKLLWTPAAKQVATEQFSKVSRLTPLAVLACLRCLTLPAQDTVIKFTNNFHGYPWMIFVTCRVQYDSQTTVRKFSWVFRLFHSFHSVPGFTNPC